MIYQLALAAIHLAYVNSRILLCGLRTLNVLSGGAVNFTDYDINADSDVCSIMLATSSYQDQSTEDRIAALQRDVAATSVGVVGVKDARGGDMLRTGPEFGVDVMRTVLAAPVAAQTTTSRPEGGVATDFSTSALRARSASASPSARIDASTSPPSPSRSASSDLFFILASRSSSLARAAAHAFASACAAHWPARCNLAGLSMGLSP